MITQPRSISTGTPLYLSSDIVVEHVSSNGVHVSDRRTGRRLHLSRPMYDFMLSFESGRAVPELHEQFERETADHVLSKLEKLMQCGFLLKTARHLEPEAPSPFYATPFTFAQTPRQTGQEGRLTAGIVGVPFDLGNVTMPGARLGPDAIRTYSQNYPPYSLNPHTLRPAGWFDAARGGRILDGVSIADWGNIRFSPCEAPDEFHERVTTGVAEVSRCCELTLLFGGDHSVTYGAVRSLKSGQPLTVIWIDAHTDLAEWHPWMGAHSHGSVARRIVESGFATELVQMGLRGLYVAQPNLRTVPYTCLGAAKLSHMSDDELREQLPMDARCYLSLDIDCLDPSEAPGTSTPVPGGLRLSRLLHLIRLICAQNHVIAADIVEVNPTRDPSGVTVQVAAAIAIALLEAATVRPHSKARKETL